MLTLSRSNNDIFSRWWWTVDRIQLLSFFILMIWGILMVIAATPMVANRIGLEEFYFFKRHMLYLIPSILTIFSISSLNRKQLLYFAFVLFLVALIFTSATLVFGTYIKGARRWISFGGLSLQPSEFTKPAMAIITAWLLSEERQNPQLKGTIIASILCGIFALLLVAQPDIGMLGVVCAGWFLQLFLNGLPIIFVIGFCVLLIIGAFFAYMLLPHVAARVDRFLNPNIGDHYQINRSMEAFASGGIWGVGPGEGIVKKHLPDAHADFIFAVIGEEFGFIFCVCLILLIGFIIVYGMLKALKNTNYFNMLAQMGLLTQFGLQALINIASTLHLIPTKGMTLPFISYGGSSMLSTSVTIGMILALSKRTTVDFSNNRGS